MTRVNLVPVEELMDQHLFAEFREIKMVPRSLERSLRARPLPLVLRHLPQRFCLGQGHVSFFYNKGLFLRQRFEELCRELAYRGINYDRSSMFDPNKVMTGILDGPYVPDQEAIALSRQRIQEKISMKPEWYRKTKRI